MASGGLIGSNQREWLNIPVAVLRNGIDSRRDGDYSNGCVKLIQSKEMSRLPLLPSMRE